MKTQPINILLVEDNPADVDLTIEAFQDAKLHNEMFVCGDGLDAQEFLYQRGVYKDKPRPDLILLDLNMPRMNGHEFLQVINKDKLLRSIPIVVLTTSSNEQDVVASYENCANCFITKPVNFGQFFAVIQAIESFWLTVVKLPGNA